MKMKTLTIISSLLLSSLSLLAQQKDPVLFSVNGVPVNKSEFSYIYAKTNGKNADFSRKSLEDYLELYIKFKLKVQKARDLKIDTISGLRTELDGYRKQLADSYLVDREVTDKLVKEVYERIKKDVELHHIFFMAQRNAPAADTLAAYEKALMVKKKIEEGAAFAEMAAAHSDDKSAENNGGNVGFITAPFPPGMYALETAAYTVPMNKLVGPIRTEGGYHLMKVTARRPARAEIEVAHLLIRKTDGNEAEAKRRIDSLYLALLEGAVFEELAAFSDDKGSAPRGGYLGFFGIGRYETTFEDAAFSLTRDSAYTKPFETSSGWHIVKRISKRDIQDLNTEKPRLENRIKNDERFQEARRAMIANIRKQNDFREFPEVLERYATTLDESFLSFRWKSAEEKSPEVLFTLGTKKKATIADFEEYLVNSARKRLRYGGSMEAVDALKLLYAEYIDEFCLRYEEENLHIKYPDFKALMREYEEGILLFEATKMEVWDKASQDSVGLEKFFRTQLQGKYRWEDRATVELWRLQTEGKDMLGDLLKMAAAKSSTDDILARFNTETTKPLSVEIYSFERSKAPDGLKEDKWRENAMTIATENPRSKEWTFYRITKIDPPADKTLKEARGYIVADYQDYLETKWVEELRKTYKVVLNKEVFEQLVKS